MVEGSRVGGISDFVYTFKLAPGAKYFSNQRPASLQLAVFYYLHILIYNAPKMRTAYFYKYTMYMILNQKIEHIFNSKLLSDKLPPWPGQ